MHFFKPLALAAALTLLSACTTGRVSDDFFFRGEPGDGVPPESVFQGEMTLGPGDVLHLRRISLGPEQPGATTSPDRAGDPASLHRIPLRRIGVQGACGEAAGGGRLYAYEREFLRSILSGVRSEGSRPAQQSTENDRALSFEDVLSRDAVALWNCMVEHLAVRRVTVDPSKDAPVTLHLRLNTDALLRAFPEDSPVRSYLTGAVRDIEQSAALELETIELNGVSIQRPRWPERQWTLLEWDQAGVLTDKNKEESRLLVLKFSRSGDRFYVAECFGLDPTHRVAVALQDGRPTRELIRTRTGLQGWFKVLHQGAALPQSNLNDLVVANLHSVEVGTGTRCGVR